mgnify:CR=1 FL=1
MTNVANLELVRHVTDCCPLVHWQKHPVNTSEYHAEPYYPSSWVGTIAPLTPYSDMCCAALCCAVACSPVL